MTQPPRRRYCLVATVQADDPEGLRAMVEDLATWVADRGQHPTAGDSVHGGPDRSWIVQLEVRPEVTTETYHEALKKYLEETKLPSFEPKAVGLCERCTAPVAFGTRYAEHEGKYLCSSCSRDLL